MYTPPDRGGTRASNKSDNSASNKKDYTGLTPRETFEKKHGINRHSQESTKSESCLPSYVWPFPQMFLFFSCDSGSGQRNWTQKFCELLTTQYNLFKSVLEYVYCVVNLIFLSALKQKTGGFWSQGLCYPHPLLFAWNSTANQSTANSGQQENPERKSKNWELVQEI